MTTTTAPTQKLQRAFIVQVRPKEITALEAALHDAGIVDDGWYEPTEVTLWWDVDKAPERFSDAEKREVARRAVKLERMTFDTPDDRDFEVKVVELVREQLVTPKPRKRK